jgi:FtsP/CotA-like multicopper oxidase with cupredoxin domain
MEVEMKRREFLRLGAGAVAGTAAGSIGLLSWSPRAHAQTIAVSLTAMHGDVTQIDGTTAFMFGFSDTSVLSVPGPAIVCQSGDSIQLTLANALDTPVVFAVTGTNIQLRVAARSTLQFAPFAAPTPGSYLYHDNQNGGVNRVLGLHGALIVMPAGIKNRAFTGGPSFTRQYKWILGNVDPVWGNAVRANGDAYVASIAATRFLPRYFTINGHSFADTHEPNTDLHGLYGEPALVRIMNAGGMVHAPHFHGNHIEICSINRTNFAGSRKSKDIVSMFPLDCRDVLVPFRRPADAWPRITNEVQRFPMHCHSEMSQTAGGGMYPHGLHCQLVLGQRPAVESEVTQAVARLP